MISKNIIQYLLFALLIILSFFFYKKYIETDKNLTQKPIEILKNNENNIIEKKKRNFKYN